MKAKMKAWAWVFPLLGLALLAISCEKIKEGSGRQIRFKAVSQPDSRTRASYSGVMVGSKERIDWTPDTDQIRIYSDNATLPNSSKHWADYKVTSAAPDGDNAAKSDAAIAVTSGNGLYWGDNAETRYKFYGVYPATAGVTADNAGASGGTAVSFSGTISGSQTGVLSEGKDVFDAEDIDIYYPSPSNAPMYMTAYAANQTESSGVSLLFNPAFTAFHIRAGAETAMTVKSVTLSAEGVGSASANPVAGAFTGTWDATESEWVYASSSTTTSVTLNLGDGVQLTPYNSTQKFFDMVLLALPTELTGLTLTFAVRLASDPSTEVYRSLKLKVAKDLPSEPVNINGRNYAAGDWLIFDACSQTYLNGMLIPESVWTIDNVTTVRMEEGVAPWTLEENDISYGTDLVVNASKLSGTSPNFNFSIFAPTGGQWKISVLDNNGEVVDAIHIVQNVSPTNEGDGTLTGTIGSPDLVDFTLSRQGGGATQDCHLSISIIVGGKEYSINSEMYPNTGGVPTTFTL